MADLHLIRDRKRTTSKSVGEDTTLIELGADAVAETPATAADLDSLKPGAKLATYLIVSKIGEGGMGAVYKAHDTVLDRTVALKILSPALFRNREYLERFRIEAQAHARLNGPNIVTLHSMFDVPGSIALVLEYVEGHTLAQRLHNEGHISIAAAIWLFEQTLLGIDRAHRLGIVHRDIKPSNIFITNSREVKLMDFGVAKIMDNNGPTQVGSIIGTLRYISPEQINGNDADFRSDIYSLGITLYEALTGTVPFKKNTEYDYMNAHLHDAPPAPSSINSGVPKELEAVVLKAIAKDPNKRFQSAREFRNALLTLGIKHVRAYRRIKAQQRTIEAAAMAQLELPPVATDTPVPLVRRYRAPVAAAIAGVVAIVLGAQFYLSKPEDAAQEVARQGSGAAVAETTVRAAAPATIPPRAATGEVQIAPLASVTPPAASVETQRAPVVDASTPGVKATPRTAMAKASKPRARQKTRDEYTVLKDAWGG